MTGSQPVGDAGTPRGHREASTVEALASQRLAASGHYAHYFRGIVVSYRDGVLILQGRLPSFYLKQVLQTLLRGLEGIELIDNQVEVAGPTALAAGRTASGSALVGMDHIRNARELLTDSATPIAKRLLYAGTEFLAASHLGDEWPEQLRRAASRIRLRLLSGGDLPSSIHTMDDATLAETAEELLLFTKLAERLDASSEVPT